MAKQKVARLSTVQRAALEHALNTNGTTTLATFNDRTIATLEKRGLIAGRSLSRHTPRRYAITDTGRVSLAARSFARTVRNG